VLGEMRLLAALTIEAADDFQPSALLLLGDSLLTVSDHQDRVVYAIDRGKIGRRCTRF
jgi:hypothetical protein